MELKQLCDAAGIGCPRDAYTMEISHVTADSRAVRKGTLFVCVRGLHRDGHAYISDAVRAGACCILTEKSFPNPAFEDVCVLQAEDTRRTLACLLHAWYGFPTKSLNMIGVTGTNGKTSVTQMLRAILSHAGHRCGLIGTVGCESGEKRLLADPADPLANMTTPDPEVLYRLLAEMVRDGVEYAIMEVSSHALALGKVEPIEFELSIFTNLTPEHLDFHQTMEAYAAAKAKLPAQSRVCVINADDPNASRMREAAKGRCVTCGYTNTADTVADAVDADSVDGVSYRIVGKEESFGIFCPVAGAFSVMNSMQAAVAARELGIDTVTIASALQHFSGVRGRMERVELAGHADFSVLIDYAHTPDALEKLLQTAQRIRRENGRILLLFGCGGERDRAKRPMMGNIAAQYADAVILTADNSRSEETATIIGEILGGMPTDTACTVITGRASAIRYAIMHARKNDLILLAGKGHEEYEITREGKAPFSEKELVRNAWRERQAHKTCKDTGTKL